MSPYGRYLAPAYPERLDALQQKAEDPSLTEEQRKAILAQAQRLVQESVQQENWGWRGLEDSHVETVRQVIPQQGGRDPQIVEQRQTVPGDYQFLEQNAPHALQNPQLYGLSFPYGQRPQLNRWQELEEQRFWQDQAKASMAWMSQNLTPVASYLTQGFGDKYRASMKAIQKVQDSNETPQFRPTDRMKALVQIIGGLRETFDPARDVTSEDQRPNTIYQKGDWEWETGPTPGDKHTRVRPLKPGLAPPVEPVMDADGRPTGYFRYWDSSRKKWDIHGAADRSGIDTMLQVDLSLQDNFFKSYGRMPAEFELNDYRTRIQAAYGFKPTPSPPPNDAQINAALRAQGLAVIKEANRRAKATDAAERMVIQPNVMAQWMEDPRWAAVFNAEHPLVDMPEITRKAALAFKDQALASSPVMPVYQNTPQPGMLDRLRSWIGGQPPPAPPPVPQPEDFQERLRQQEMQQSMGATGLDQPMMQSQQHAHQMVPGAAPPVGGGSAMVPQRGPTPVPYQGSVVSNRGAPTPVATGAIQQAAPPIQRQAPPLAPQLPAKFRDPLQKHLPHPKTPEEIEQLPEGAEFIAPDGSKRRNIRK